MYYSSFAQSACIILSFFSVGIAKKSSLDLQLLFDTGTVAILTVSELENLEISSSGIMPGTRLFSSQLSTSGPFSGINNSLPHRGPLPASLQAPTCETDPSDGDAAP